MIALRGGTSRIRNQEAGNRPAPLEFRSPLCHSVGLRHAAAFGVLLAVLSGCEKLAPPPPASNAWTPGMVYSLRVSPTSFVACKVLEAADGQVRVCLFKSYFDHRPTREEFTALSIWVPVSFTVKTLNDSDPAYLADIPPTKSELDHLHKAGALSPEDAQWKNWDPAQPSQGKPR